jgi:thymidylate synthase (FAD)
MTHIKAKYVDHMGSDLSAVNAARTSFGKHHTEMTAGDTKLIKYLASNGHISPFGHAFASFQVKAPIFVARQLVKHKFLRWNEVSRRYVSTLPEFYEPDVWRGQAQDKKQGSAGVVADVNIKTTQRLVGMLYEDLLAQGVCEEQARMVLPQNTFTEWYWSGSVDALASMCKLRCSTDTQVETQDVAWQIYWVMEELYPVSWKALMEEY